MKRICDTRANCGQRYCIHNEDHECQAADDTGRHNCEWMGLVRCNPVEEPAKVVCNRKDACQFKGCPHREEHEIVDMRCDNIPCGTEGSAKGAKCEPVPEPTDLTSPLRPPRGPALYQCTKAAVCGIKECNAFDDHTHNEPAFHGPRECYFIKQDVDCEPVPSQQAAPLQGVYFSGKAVEVLSVLKGMDPAEWDKLWAMVTGKTERPSTWAQDQMAQEKAERDRAPDSMTPAVFESSVRAIILEQTSQIGSPEGIAARATARIVKLLPIGGTGEASGRVSEK